ncbi:MAG: acetate--CoA ligase family protein [archaeon]
MRTLSLPESIELAKKYGIEFAEYATARNEAELGKACSKMGFPVAMKIISPKISHKTDSGGVKINIANPNEAKKEFTEMRKLRGFEGVLVQEMLHGKEVIIGGKRDVQFGPTVLFGLGGIYVEVFKDYNIGICPLKKSDAREMVQSLKSYPILRGAREKRGVDLKAIEEAILKVSKLMQKEKQVQELDLNPLIATSEGVKAVDARIIVE